MSLQLSVKKDYIALSRYAARLIAEEILQKPNALICIATGSTPTGAYQSLAAIKKKDPAAFKKVRIIKLDEWGGLAMRHPATCESNIQKYIIEPLGVSKDRYIRFVSDPKNPARECVRIERALALAGPIDLCVLGLGANGHLGFNEPAACLHPEPHVAALTATSRTHNMVKNCKQKITHGLTLGMSAIMNSQKVLLLVNGAHKAGQVKQLMSGKVTTEFPASFLWLHHDAVCLCDRAAASRLPAGK